MIVVDANLLIYAYDTTCPEHTSARTWLEQTFSGTELVGVPWQAIYAFVRITTHPGISPNRIPLAQAIAIVEEWFQVPHLRALATGDAHWSLFREMLLKAGAHGNLTTDACLAAIALENGGVLYSTDRDFARFPGLRWVNPLTAS